MRERGTMCGQTSRRGKKVRYIDKAWGKVISQLSSRNMQIMRTIPISLAVGSFWSY